MERSAKIYKSGGGSWAAVEKTMERVIQALMVEVWQSQLHGARETTKRFQSVESRGT